MPKKSTKQKPDDIKLLPCPFCGQQPNVAASVDQGLWCLTHRCSGVGSISIGWNRLDSIAARWNNRYPLARNCPADCNCHPSSVSKGKSK